MQHASIFEFLMSILLIRDSVIQYSILTIGTPHTLVSLFDRHEVVWIMLQS